VPTIAITDRELSPRTVAERLAQQEIYVWNGNNYAVEISERLGMPLGTVKSCLRLAFQKLRSRIEES
jgi:selenocysteine lyase/cysteine desulfurase